MLKSENSFDIVINHITFNAMHNEKFHFMWKLIQLLSISILFSLETIKKCQLWHLCVLRGNLKLSVTDEIKQRLSVVVCKLLVCKMFVCKMFVWKLNFCKLRVHKLLVCKQLVCKLLICKLLVWKLFFASCVLTYLVRLQATPLQTVRFQAARWKILCSLSIFSLRLRSTPKWPTIDQMNFLNVV